MRKAHISRGRFIRLGATLGVGAAGASILAACGGGGGGGGEKASEETTSAPGAVGGATEATAPGGTTVAEIARGEAIAQESDVAPGSAVEFTDSETSQQAVLVHLQSGDFVAYSAICTHRGCTVGYSDDKLVCPCHGSIFDPANGAQVEAGPAPTPLPQIPVQVQNGEVLRA